MDPMHSPVQPWREYGPFERVPIGWGRAWTDVCRDVNIALPIPFNFVAAWVRDAWMWLRRGPKSQRVTQVDLHTLLDRRYLAGHEAGFKQAMCLNKLDQRSTSRAARPS